MEKKSINMPYWKEYPERDTEFVRSYPTLYKAIKEEEIWTKTRIGFYIHLPFCYNLCMTCPYTKVKPKAELVARYLSALKNEISNYASRPYIKDHVFDVGYFGGGTPTSLNIDQFCDLLQFIKGEFNMSNEAELSTESTPVDINQEKAKKLIENGINRISIGVQSFFDKELEEIGRNYTGEKAMDTIKMIQDVGFKNINIDLLYGMPAQTVSSWEKTLEKAIELKVPVISMYNYFLIPNNIVTRKIITGDFANMMKDEDRNKCFYLACDLLKNAGYEGLYGDQMCLPGHVSKFLTIPWDEHADLVAMGAWALGKVRDYWYFNEPEIPSYIEKAQNGELPVIMGAKITKKDDMRRTMALAIKSIGVSRQNFKDSYGKDLYEVFPDIIDRLINLDLVELNDEFLKIKGFKGMYYIENISKSFFEEKYKRFPQAVNKDISKYLAE